MPPRRSLACASSRVLVPAPSQAALPPVPTTSRMVAVTAGEASVPSAGLPRMLLGPRQVSESAGDWVGSRREASPEPTGGASESMFVGVPSATGAQAATAPVERGQ